uniref:Uncharacterized protein n=1 Tax=Rhizophora mucronata TaxID=61149 RepID=A0A2P2QYZ8_RHIMU
MPNIVNNYWYKLAGLGKIKKIDCGVHMKSLTTLF